MARPIPEKRFQELVEAATRIFIAQGYRRTQMADVAAALSLGKGTLYGYVASKAALFLFTAEHCDDRDPIPVPTTLPVPNPEAGATLAVLQERMAREANMPRLTAALQREAPPATPAEVATELEGILREFYRVLHANHRAIRLMESCALDHPELAAHWHDEGRYAYLALMEHYLEGRRASGALAFTADAAAVARFVLETVTTWAVHIHFDSNPQVLSPETSEQIVMHFLLKGLLTSA